MRRLPLVLAVFLALAPAAAAHVTVSPDLVEPGSDPVLTFSVPNESGSDVVSLVVRLPEGVSAEQAAEPPGWRVSAAQQRVEWRGRLAPGRLASFSISTSIGARRELVIDARERHADGSVAVWQPRLRVIEAVAGRDSRSRTLGKSALFVAIAALVLAVGAGFLALFVWLRSGAP